MKKKIGVWLLLAAMLVGMSACGTKKGSEANPTTSATTTTAIETEAEIRENLPERDFNGETFTILTGDYAQADFDSDGEDGEILNDAVFRRNSAIENRFNVKLNVLFDAEATVKARTAVQANDAAYDVVMDKQVNMMPFSLEGMLLDWKNFEYLALEKPWWNQNVMRDISFGNKVYLMTGDLNPSTLGMTCIILFNKTLFDAMDIPYPYQLAADKKWTYDEFLKIVAQGSQDLNGDAKLTYDADRYGYVGWQYEIGPNLLTSLGASYVAKDKDNMPILNIGQERTFQIIDRILKIFEEGQGGWQNDIEWGPDMDVFSEGRSLMLDSRFTLLNDFRDMKDDFGILPHPMFDEKQEEYYQLVSNVGTLCGIPITNAKQEMTGILLEAIAAESYREVMPMYYEVVLQTKNTRDDESAEMLDIVKNSSRFDMSLQTFNSGNILSLIQQGQNTFASDYAKKEKAAQKEIKKILDNLEKMGE